MVVYARSLVMAFSLLALALPEEHHVRPYHAFRDSLEILHQMVVHGIY